MLGIVIVNWNTKELLEECIDHINRLRVRLPYEIIVVDNASDDGSRKFLSSRFMGRKILNEKNMGFGAACNLAARTFSADTLLFLNTDAFPEKGAIEEMYEILISTDDVALVSPQLTNRNGSLQRTAVSFPFVLRDPMLGKYNFLPSNFESDQGEYDSELIERTDAVTGACMMVKRHLFHTLGGFDENFFFFLEETDFCLRAKRLGYSILVAKRARCVHLKGKSASKDLMRFRKIFLSSHFLFLKKHLPSGIYRKARFFQILRIAWKSALYFLLSLLTFFVIPSLRFKWKLYSGFIAGKGWKDAEKNFTGIFRGGIFYRQVKAESGEGYIAKEISSSFEKYLPLEDKLKESGETIKDAVYSLTSVIDIQGESVNVKLFRKKRRIPFLAPYSERAFYGALVLKSLGVPVPEIVGYFVDKKKSKSFLLTVHDYKLEVLNFIFSDIEKACLSNRVHYYPLKKKLFISLAYLFRKLHNTKVIHRDLKASNILVKTDWDNEDDPFRIFLIDFEDIVVDPPAMERIMIKNLAQLNKSFPDLSLISVKERLFFLKKYLGITKLDERSKKLIVQIEKMTKKMFKRKKITYYRSENESH